MSSDEKVLDFPRVEGTSEENARRVMVEATRLARLAPGEWRLWIDRSAERLRIPRAILEDVIAAIIKNSEKKELLQKISAKIRKYIVLRPEAVIATALWTMTAWAPEGATHSYSSRNFCRTRFRQEHPPWRSTFSSAETVCQRRTDRSQRIPYG